MGCGTSNTRDELNNKNKQAEFNLNLITDVNMRNYSNLIKNGLIYLDYPELTKNPQYNEAEGITLKGVKIVGKIVNDQENISKLLNSFDKIMGIKKALKEKNPNSELGIYYDTENLIFFLITSLFEVNYENDICQIFKQNNLSMSTTLDLNEKLPIYLLLKLTNSLKQNKTVKTVILQSIVDDFVFKSIVYNLITNVYVEKLICSKLGLNEESSKIFEDYFKYNQNLSKLKLDNNKIETFQSIKNALILNPNMSLTCLNLSNNKFKNFEYLGKYLTFSKVIQKLNLSKILIKNEEEFNTIFKENTKNLAYLTKLDLSFNYVSLSVLSDIIKNSKNLKKLTLQKIKFSDSDLGDLSNFYKEYLNSIIENMSINFDNSSAIKYFFMGGTESSNSNTLKRFKLFKSIINDEACDIMCQAFTNNDIFKELDLSYCSISNFEKFFDTCGLLKSLSTLNLSSCPLSQENLETLSINLPKCSFKNLEFEKNNFNQVGEDAFRKFCQGLNDNNSINKINLNYCFSSENHIYFNLLCDNLKMKNLYEIFIENCDFPMDKFGHQIAKLISNNLKIKILKIGSKNEIFKPNLNNMILKSLSQNKSLESFSMTNIKVTGEALKEFMKNENANNQLKFLKFDNICGETQFLEALPHMPKLQNLDISIFSITDINHTKSIQTLLKSNNKLENLFLKISNLPVENLDAIIEGLKYNTSLKRFQVFPPSLVSIHLPAICKYYNYAKEKKSNFIIETLNYMNDVKADEKLINDAHNSFIQLFK